MGASEGTKHVGGRRAEEMRMIGSDWGYEPESPLNNVNTDVALRELRSRLVQEDFFQVVKYVAKAYRSLAKKQQAALIAASMGALHALAIQAKDWNMADQMCIEALRRYNPNALREILHAEGYARAFNILLAENLARARTLVRYIDTVEVPSYAGWTFESRIEYGGWRRGYKAFSIYENPFSTTRPITVIIPIDREVRKVVRPVTYTALLRPLQQDEERIDDQKHITHAYETECRIPDGTRVPIGTKMLVQIEKLDATVDVEELRSACGSIDMTVI